MPRRSDQLKSILRSPGRRVLHDIKNIRKFGDGKSQREVAFVRVIELEGNFSIKIILYFTLAVVHMIIYRQIIGNLDIFGTYAQCFIPEFQGSRFTFYQIINISSSDENIGYSDYAMTQYCYYYDLNYTNLLIKNNYNYTAIMEDNSRLNYKAKIQCDAMVVKPYRDYLHRYQFLCERGRFIYYWKVLPDVGKIASMIIMGAIADLYGRQLVYIICTCIACVCYILSSFSDIPIVLFTRFMLGIGGYNAQLMVTLIFLESCSPKSRKYLGFFLFHSIPITWILYLIATNVIKHNSFAQLFECFSIVISLFTMATMGESLRWLVVTEREDAIWEILDKGAHFAWIRKYNKWPDLKHHFNLYFKPIFRERMLIALTAYALLIILEDSSSIALKTLFTEQQKMRYLMMFIGEQIVVLYLVYIVLVNTSMRTCLLTTYFCTLALDSAIYVQQSHWFNTKFLLGLVEHSMVNSTYMLLFLYAVKLFPTTHRATTLAIFHTAYSVTYVINASVMEYMQYLNPAYSHLPCLCCTALTMFLIACLPNLYAKELPDKPVEALHGQVVK